MCNKCGCPCTHCHVLRASPVIQTPWVVSIYDLPAIGHFELPTPMSCLAQLPPGTRMQGVAFNSQSQPSSGAQPPQSLQIAVIVPCFQPQPLSGLGAPSATQQSAKVNFEGVPAAWEPEHTADNGMSSLSPYLSPDHTKGVATSRQLSRVTTEIKYLLCGPSPSGLHLRACRLCFTGQAPIPMEPLCLRVFCNLCLSMATAKVPMAPPTVGPNSKYRMACVALPVRAPFGRLK